MFNYIKLLWYFILRVMTEIHNNTSSVNHIEESDVRKWQHYDILSTMTAKL